MHHLDNLRILAELFATGKGDAVGTGILFKQRVDGYDEGRHELALVGNDGYLVDVFVYEQLRFYHLRGNILAVAGFEEVFDALRQEQFAVLHISGIASAEIAVVGEGLTRQVFALVVAAGDGGTLEQYLALFADFDVDALDGYAHAAHGIGVAQMVAADGGQRLGESVAHNHIDANGMDEFFNIRTDGSTCRGEEMGVLQSQFLTHQREDGTVQHLVL